MTFSFDSDTAQAVGVLNAVVLENIAYWVRLNETSGRNEKDGKYWTYNSVKGFLKYFPFLTVKQIRRALDTLVSEKYLEVSSFNKASFDRTRWFTITDKAKELLRYGQLELPEKANDICPDGQITSAQKGEPIPVLTQSNTHCIPPYSPPEGEPTPKRERKRFTPPKLEEVEAYCRERNNSVDASRFLDYYEAVGWKVGKQPMKDWKAAVRTWERRDASNASSQAKKEETYRAPVFVGYDEEGRGIYK